jgi:hypothetical protein
MTVHITSTIVTILKDKDKIRRMIGCSASAESEDLES